MLLTLVPQIPASLLVARICTGDAPGRPISSAGSRIRPPPPTTASTNPAASAASASSASTAAVGSSTSEPRMGVRIVSLLPSTTEILFAIGAGDDVVGVTFECDYPARPAAGRSSRPARCPRG